MKDAEIIIHTDGGARGNPGPAACAFVAEVGDKIIEKRSRYLGVATNNYAEYQGLILAMQWLPAKSQIFFYLDSELVVKQLTGLYKVKNQNLKKLNDEIMGIVKEKQLTVVFKNIPREKNTIADALVNKELDENPNN